MQCVIISFDSLATNSLGCYGNEWIETPHCDRLAATGAVFDYHFADSVGGLAGTSWCTGRHVHSPAPCINHELGFLLRSRGIASRLIVDGESRPWQQAIPFDQVTHVNGRDGTDGKPDETPFAQVVKSGISAWNDPSFQSQPRLLWLHSSGPGVPPVGFDDLYFEDFEERGQLLDELNAQDRAKHPAVYAGSVSLLDHWLGELLGAVESQFVDQPTLVIVTAAQGDLWQIPAIPSTAESQRYASIIGDQLARTPLLLKICDPSRFKDVTCVRSHRLVQACDLVPTLCDWFEAAETGSAVVGRSWLRELAEVVEPRSSLFFSHGDEHVAVRTPEWLCIAEKTQTEGDAMSAVARNRVALFVKPDDIWEINDVASQHPEIAEELIKSVTPSV